MGATSLAVTLVDGARELPLSTARSFGRVLGASLEMRRLYPLCQRLATSDVPVVIEGETGTGKEALAESLHESGPRAAGPRVSRARDDISGVSTEGPEPIGSEVPDCRLIGNTPI